MKKLNIKAVFKKFALMAIATGVIVSTSMIAFADELTPTSLLDTQTTQLVKDFGADLVPTYIALLLIVIPVGLAIFAIKLGAFKGIGMLKKFVWKG